MEDSLHPKWGSALPPFYTAIVRCLGVLEGLAIEVSFLFLGAICLFRDSGSPGTYQGCTV